MSEVTDPLPEESTQDLYENAPCGYLTTRPDGTIVRVNSTFLRWTGYARDTLLSGRRFQDLLTTPGRIFYETHLAPLLRMQERAQEIAFDLVLANKRIMPVLANCSEVRAPDGRPLSIRTTLVDATDRRAYERELLLARRRAEQLAAVVAASGDAIMLMDPDGTLRTWNGGAERLFGWTAGDAVGRNAKTLLVPDDRLEEYDRMLEELRAGREVRLETVRLDRDGRRLEVSLTATPHAEALQEVVAAISSIIRDMSQQHRLEEERRRAERLRTVGTLAGGVAHEVNNQMTTVLGLGGFVERELGPDHPQTADVRGMMDAAARAARMSQQLLAFSRQQLSDPRLLDLHEVVTDLVPLMSDLLGAERHLHIEPDMPRARTRTDPAQVEQIVINLATNARDAMLPGDHLFIGVRDAELGAEEIRAHPADDVVPGAYVLMTVRDTGHGMDEATLARIFEPFFTTKPVGQGTGLGLAMVYGMVKQHGGQVWAASVPGKGTTLRVYFPAVDPD